MFGKYINLLWHQLKMRWESVWLFRFWDFDGHILCRHVATHTNELGSGICVSYFLHFFLFEWFNSLFTHWHCIIQNGRRQQLLQNHMFKVLIQKCNKTSCFCLKMNQFWTFYHIFLNNFKHSLEAYSLSKICKIVLEYTLKCSQLISSLDNKKIRLDSGRYTTKCYFLWL